jgi:nucleoside-diphosphate-sugar epimerase
MVYRDGGDRWLDEDAPLDESARRSAACRPVVEAEAMIRLIDPQMLPWTILRGGSFVGAGTRQDVLIERLRSRGAVVAGDGSNYLSPLNVADMASAVAAALRYAPAGSTFNIVDEPLRYADYVDALADLIGVTRPPRAAARPLPDSRRCTSSAARTALGWMPRHPIWPSRRAAGEPTSSSSGWA